MFKCGRNKAEKMNVGEKVFKVYCTYSTTFYICGWHQQQKPHTLTLSTTLQTNIKLTETTRREHIKLMNEPEYYDYKIVKSVHRRFVVEKYALSRLETDLNARIVIKWFRGTWGVY